MRVELHRAVRPGRVAEGREARYGMTRAIQIARPSSIARPPRLPAVAAASGSPPRPVAGLAAARHAFGQEKEVLPKHVTPETLRAVIKGLDYLAAHPGRGRLVDHRRRPGLSGRDDRPGRDGLPGPRQLAHAGQVFEERPGGRRVPRPVQHADGADHRPGAGQRPADARARLRAHVPGVGLRHDHQGVAPPARSATRSARP